MKMNKKLVAILLLVVMVVSLAACSGNSIVGKWKLEQNGVTVIMDFGSDNKVKTIAAGQTVLTQDYKVDGNKLIMDGGEATFKIDGDKLALTEGGITLTLTRAK